MKILITGATGYIGVSLCKGCIRTWTRSSLLILILIKTT